MSKIDLKKEVKDIEGNSIGTKQCWVLEPNKKDLVKNADGSYMMITLNDTANKLTLKNVIERCLVADVPLEAGKQQLTREEKVERSALFFRIQQANGSIDFDAKEISTIQDIIWATESTLIAGQACSYLEPKDKK
jgi:hypothetical protein